MNLKNVDSTLVSFDLSDEDFNSINSSAISSAALTTGKTGGFAIRNHTLNLNGGFAIRNHALNVV